MEQEFGIEEYVDGQMNPIPCILKQLYTDFIVQEIGENNEAISIRPNCLKVSQQEDAEKVDVPAPECLTADVLEDLDKYVSALGEKSKEIFSINTKGFSKEERTSIHKFIRQRFAGTLNTELKDDDIVVTSSSGDRNARKRKRWSPDNPDYLHFTLAKENKDTAYALGIVAKFIGVKPDLFRTCGIKDKRAVTSQKVSCYRVEKEKLIKIIPRLRDFTLFDFEYRKEGLKMGGHWGNRFNIVLRNVPPASREEMAERCEVFKSKGFINYFGTQRFGSSLNNTAETGRLILQRKWEAAVKNIMKVTAEMGKTTVSEAAAHFLETGDAQAALKKLRGGQTFASTESNIFRALTRGRTWQQIAFCLTEVLPVNIRSLYVHAYQSLIWNKLVTQRVREFGCEAVTEDVDKDGNWLTDGNIFSAYIPLPGSDLKLFPEYAKEWLNELLAKDGLTNDSFIGLRDRFSLGDSSRPLLVLPGNVQYKFIFYSQPREVLQDGLIDRKEQKTESDNNGDLLALKIQFNLPNGVYATVALRQVTGYDMGKGNMAEAGKELLQAAERDEIAEDEIQNDGEIAEAIE